MYEHLSNLTSEPTTENSDKTTGVIASWTMTGFTGGDPSSLETPRTPIERSCSSRMTDLCTAVTLSMTIGLLLS